jgi:hypothetical protein
MCYEAAGLLRADAVGMGGLATRLDTSDVNCAGPHASSVRSRLAATASLEGGERVYARKLLLALNRSASLRHSEQVPLFEPDAQVSG